jgi:DNA-binding transcriptional MerR regulator
MQIEQLKHFRIGELADMVGMSPRTIRYYQEIGLLHPAKRAEGRKRLFTENDLQRLRFIKRLKHLGLTLSEMNELASIYKIHQTNRNVLCRLCELLDNQVGKIDERINNLVRLKEDILSYREKIYQKMSLANES